MEIIKAKLTSTAPLLMHNGQLADPTNKFTIALSKYTKGKAKDPIEARRLEFMGSLYTDEAGEPCLPGDMIYACVIKGAAARKKGKEVKAGVYESAPNFALKYDGPREAKALYEDGRFADYRGVRVGQVRVQRSRPIFRSWAVTISLDFDPKIIERSDIEDALHYAGRVVGLGDYRPRFGRFTVEIVK